MVVVCGIAGVSVFALFVLGLRFSWIVLLGYWMFLRLSFSFTLCSAGVGCFMNFGFGLPFVCFCFYCLLLFLIGLFTMFFVCIACFVLYSDF